MSDFDPNEKQGRLIESTDGLHLVDAGAGTGKIHRHSSVRDDCRAEDADPADIPSYDVPINKRAAEMKERIVSQREYGMRELTDAPIQTFHSLANDRWRNTAMPS